MLTTIYIDTRNELFDEAFIERQGKELGYDISGRFMLIGAQNIHEKNRGQTKGAR